MITGSVGLHNSMGDGVRIICDVCADDCNNGDSGPNGCGGEKGRGGNWAGKRSCEVPISADHDPIEGDGDGRSDSCCKGEKVDRNSGGVVPHSSYAAGDEAYGEFQFFVKNESKYVLPN